MPRLVEVLRVQPLGVLGAELEDVADLDDALDLERLAALPARLAGGHRVQIDEARLEVAPRTDAAQVEALAVRADDVRPLAERLVGQDRHARAHLPHGADRSLQLREHPLRMTAERLVPEHARSLSCVQ